MLPGLDAILAPPAGGVGAACGPGQVLSGQALARLQLVELRGEALVGLRHCGVRLLLLAGAVLGVPGPGELLPGPALGFCPLLLGEAALDIGKRAWQGEFPGLYDLIRLSPYQGLDGTDYWDHWLALATVGSGFCFSAGRYLRFGATHPWRRQNAHTYTRDMIRNGRIHYDKTKKKT